MYIPLTILSYTLTLVANLLYHFYLQQSHWLGGYSLAQLDWEFLHFFMCLELGKISPMGWPKPVSIRRMG